MRTKEVIAREIEMCQIRISSAEEHMEAAKDFNKLEGIGNAVLKLESIKFELLIKLAKLTVELENID